MPSIKSPHLFSAFFCILNSLLIASFILEFLHRSLQREFLQIWWDFSVAVSLDRMSSNQVERKWEQRVVSEHKGKRIVHYVIWDTTPNNVLAVVGTQTTQWHMSYTVTEDYLRVFGSTRDVHVGTCWTTRKEVIKFLESVAKKGGPIFANSDLQQMEAAPHLKDLMFLMTRFSLRRHLQDVEAQKSKQLVAQNSEIVWSGDARVCSKGLKHYPALCRNETNISVYSMVWALDEEREYFIGYVKDLYENRQGGKMVRLLRFLSRQEAEGLIPTLNPECREVFLTSKEEDISANDIDGLAAVLAPSHFKKCGELLPLNLSFKCFMCRRQMEGNSVRSCIIDKLPGYSSQPVFPVLKSLMAGPSTTAQNATEDCNPQKPCFQVKANENIELLSQDSGMRGCWFRCKVLRANAKLLRVQYHDVQDADGPGKLEEWVPAVREAAPDSMGLRHAGRLTVRPWPHWDSSAVRFEAGDAVDAWWCDGWWEGIVIGYPTSAQTTLQVYLPGEKRCMTMERKNLRISKDWVDNKWVDVRRKPDILSVMINPTLAISSGSSPPANARLPDSSPVEEAANQQLPSSSESKKPAEQEQHIVELLKIRENEDWTRKGRRAKAKKMARGNK